MSNAQAFQGLTPEQMLDAVEQTGVQSDGRFLALNSYENRVYRVGVEDQPPIVAKFYRPNRWSDAAILEEHQFTLALAEEEVPVIAPVVADDDSTLHHCDGFRLALYPCHGGRAPELDNPDHLEVIGRLVGRVHAMGRMTDYQHRPDISIASYGTDSSGFLLQNNFIPTHLIDAWTSLIDQLISHIGFCFDRAGQVNQIRLHGDLHHGNVLWTDEGPLVVDFDDARTGPAIQDLWMFLSGDRDYMSARLADLMEGYCEFSEFNPAELHLVEALRTLRMIHHAGWLAMRWQDPAFPLAFPWFNTMQYWEQLILDLREQQSLMEEEPLRYFM